MANESTTGGPLTATVGEQLKGKGHLDAVQEAARAAGGRPRRRASARLPWGALAAAAAGWLLAKSIARAVRRR